MATCENCKSFVTSNFVRVFGDNEGCVHGCPECMDLSRLNKGQAAVSSPDVTIE